jgi:hypothetical protein
MATKQEDGVGDKEYGRGKRYLNNPLVRHFSVKK